MNSNFKDLGMAFMGVPGAKSFESVMGLPQGQQMPYQGALSGRPPMQRMNVAGPPGQPQGAPGFDWRQMMQQWGQQQGGMGAPGGDWRQMLRSRYPMGFGGFGRFGR